MKTELSELEFSNVKAQVLKGKDLSRKGAIDELIVDLVSLLNSRTDFVTTSSCSGRIIVVSKECAQAVKKGCKWVFVSHEEAKGDDFINCLKSASGNLVVKFEPFILHALCRTTSAAKSLLTLALQSGYRNSGITLGKHGKITVAIRSTLNLEVPISYNGELLVSEQVNIFSLDSKDPPSGGIINGWLLSTNYLCPCKFYVRNLLMIYNYSFFLHFPSGSITNKKKVASLKNYLCLCKFYVSKFTNNL
ncbi:hypothetical protein AAG570_006266 [Ranatra chinensis]|uniref:tRNA wybutosine-synthesizing protein 3 homolog n=1 Tax=Ranatra chinensis TaxID=642074 RepID=A0ABD0YTG9_9HEMI